MIIRWLILWGYKILVILSRKDNGIIKAIKVAFFISYNDEIQLKFESLSIEDLEYILTSENG